MEFEDIASGEGILNKDISDKFDRRKGIPFEPDNILYGKLRPYLKNWLFVDFKGIALGDFWVFKAIDTAPQFIYYLIQTDKYQEAANLSTGTKMPRSDWNTVSSTEFTIPADITEQTAIANFFRTLDTTITLHKRKLDCLKELKVAYLQQMFPQNYESVPQLRLSGFDGEWQERKLGEIVERITRKNVNLESTLPLTISAQHGLIDQAKFFDKQVASRDVSGYFLVKNGEFAYNKSYSNGYPWGAVKRLDKHEMGVLSTLYIVFTPTDVDSEFLVQYYETSNWHKEVSKRAAEGARNHGLLNIAPSDFFDTSLLIPTSVEEQIVIGKFFDNLNVQITTQRTRLNKLKQLKQTYLKNMFI